MNPNTLLERPSPQTLFSPEALRCETQLFERVPLYLGPAHANEQGFLRVPPWAPDLYLSARPDARSVSVRSNLCLHWQADLLEPTHPDGFLPFQRSILCKSHHAVYSASDGQLLNPQRFGQTCTQSLPEIPHLAWQGFLFRPPDWQGLGQPFELSTELARVTAETGDLFSARGYRLVKSIAMEQAGHWALFVLNYLDLLHVDPAHPDSLAQLCDCTQSQSWPGLQFEQAGADRWTAVQQVGWKRSWGQESGAGWDDPDHPQRGRAAFHRWGQIYREIKGDPPVGAIWVTLFPQLMMEWYPGVIVMSQVFPHSDPSRCRVFHDFYYDSELLEHPDFVAVQQVAFHVTGDEDEHMVGSMSRNLLRLARRGERRKTGFIHPQLEDCSPMYYARLAEVYAALS
jgi:choline monooxygenase